MTGQPERRTRSLAAIGGWLLAAAAATAVGLLATGAIGTGITGTSTAPLSEQQVARALARGTPAPAPSPQPTPTARATPAGEVTRVLDTPGGTVIARCRAGQATLISWSPAQGYDSEHIRPGPAPTASLTFDGPDTATRVRVTCPAGIPTAHTTTGPDADTDND
jgi:hypothetical protein